MIPIRTLIVDDEPKSRERIAELLVDRPEFIVVGQCGSGREAMASAADLEPDLVFLDVQLAGMDAFQLLGSLEGRSPAVVFVTAYEEHAARAFEVHAVDYLVKPFDDERFERALGRVRDFFQDRRSAELQRTLARLLDQYQESESTGLTPGIDNAFQNRHPDRILLKTNEGRTIFLKVDRIDWIEAAAYYAKIHVGEEVFLVRISLNKLEEQLDPRVFVRIHRSTIVNLERVVELEPWMNATYLVLLKDGTRLRMSRSRRDNLADLFGRSP